MNSSQLPDQEHREYVDLFIESAYMEGKEKEEHELAVAEMVGDIATTEALRLEAQREIDEAKQKIGYVDEEEPDHSQEIEEQAQKIEPEVVKKRKSIIVGRKKNHEGMSQDWDDVQIDGAVFEALTHRLSSQEGKQRKAIHLAPSRRVAKKLGMEEDIKISYEEVNNGREAIFEGMLVPEVESLRGRGLGLGLFKYWRNGIDEKGMQFGGTRVIRKPSVAKVLMSAGLQPTWRHGASKVIGILLPRDSEDEFATPTVYVVGDHEVIMEAIKHSQSDNKRHTFYDVVTTQAAKEILQSRQPGENWEQYCEKNRIPLNARWMDPK